MCVSKASSATPRGSQCRLNNPPRPCLWKNGKLSSARLVTGAKKFGDHCKGYCSIHQTTDTRLLSGQKKKKKMSKMSLALLAQQGLGGSKAMAPHSSTLAWKIPWTREPGRLQFMGSLESDTTEQLHFHFSLSCIGEGNGNPLQCSCLENPRDRGPGGLPSMGSCRVGHN